MHRKISFRAWYKPDKRMIYDVQNEFEEKIELGMNCFADYINNRDFIVEQYIGLKDKKGKEIYEGDIVKVFYEDTESLTVCKWTPERSRFILEDTKKYPKKSVTTLFPKNILVVGNVHENHNLI